MFDNSIEQTSGSGVTITLKNHRTATTSYIWNNIQTKSNGQ